MKYTTVKLLLCLLLGAKCYMYACLQSYTNNSMVKLLAQMRCVYAIVTWCLSPEIRACVHVCMCAWMRVHTLKGVFMGVPLSPQGNTDTRVHVYISLKNHACHDARLWLSRLKRLTWNSRASQTTRCWVMGTDSRREILYLLQSSSILLIGIRVLFFSVD